MSTEEKAHDGAEKSTTQEDTGAPLGAQDQILNQLFGETSIKQYRSPDGKFVRSPEESSSTTTAAAATTSAPSAGVPASAGGESRGTKRTSEEAGLAPISNVVQKHLPSDDKTPVQMTAGEYKMHLETEARVQEMEKQLKEAQAKADQLDSIKHAMGTQDTEFLKEFLTKAQKEEAKKELDLVDMYINEMDNLQSRVKHDQYNENIKKMKTMFESLKADPKNLLTPQYATDIKPILTTMIAASMDSKRNLINMTRTEEENKRIMEELNNERKLRLQMENNLGLQRRAVMSRAPSTFMVHASRDSSIPASSQSTIPSGLSSLGSFSASSSKGHSSSSASSHGGVTRSSGIPSSSSLFGTSASSGTSAASGGGGGLSPAMSEKAMGKLPAIQDAHSAGAAAQGSNHQGAGGDASLNGYLGMNDAGVPTFSSATDLLKPHMYTPVFNQFVKRRDHGAQVTSVRGGGSAMASSSISVEMAHALRSASEISANPNHWKHDLGLGEGDRVVPVRHGNIMFM